MKWVLESPFPSMMKENIDRSLRPYTRDYLFVTGIKVKKVDLPPQVPGAVGPGSGTQCTHGG